MGICNRYFGAYYKNSIEKHLKSLNIFLLFLDYEKSSGYKADLLISTIGNDS